MRLSAALGVSAALIPFVSSTPTDFNSNEREQSVKQIPQTVKGESKDKLNKAPSTLSSQTVDFLKRYQHYSDDASKVVPSYGKITFSSEGQCYAEYPCFSVNKAEKAAIKSSDGKPVPEITEGQMTKLLDAILAEKDTHFDDSNPDSPRGGLKHAEQDATLEIIAPKGKVPSNEAAGMVFDTYKLQAGDDSTNAVRAVIAQPENGPKAQIAFCLYPNGVDQNAAKNFCIGKELDGSAPHKQPATRNVDTGHLPREISEKWEKMKRSIPGLGGDSSHTVQARDPKGGSSGKSGAAAKIGNQAGSAASVVNAGVGADNLACKFGDILLVCPRPSEILEARKDGDPDEWLDDEQDLSKGGSSSMPIAARDVTNPPDLTPEELARMNQIPEAGLPLTLGGHTKIGRSPKGGSGEIAEAVGKAGNQAGNIATFVNAGVEADNLACKFAHVPIICPRSMETLDELQSLDRRSPKGGSGGIGGAVGKVGIQAGNTASVVSAGVGAGALACTLGDTPFLCPRSIETAHDDFADLVARDAKGGSGAEKSSAGDIVKEAGRQAGNAASVVNAGMGIDTLACKFGHVPVICPRNIEVPHEHLSSLVARDPKGSSGGDKGSGGKEGKAGDAVGTGASVVNAVVGTDTLACKFADIPVVCPRTVEMAHEDFAELVARSPKGGSGGGKPGVGSAGKAGDAIGTGASAVNAVVGADTLGCKLFDIPIVCPNH
ncbi:MAG: hypothetical protein M1836_000815 [Candelina mexicana]|nr:MAG: hypothetical protein M1836_000815 [Candelina mexicana]